MSNKIVIYTAIFGPYNDLIPQRKIHGIDYICFTDQPFKSNTWKVIQVKPEFDDNTKNNRKFKLLPHKYLSDYDYSIYMDGNFLVRRNITDFINHHLSQHKMVIFDHAQNSDSRSCVYDEYEAIITLGKEDGFFKDDPEVMRKQVEHYRKEGYPVNNGLIAAGVLIRKHNDPEVIKLMETWWNELKKGSKRDQLSFNYSAWKNDFPLHYLDGNIRDNENFLFLGKHRKSFKSKYFRYRLKKFFGLKK